MSTLYRRRVREFDVNLGQAFLPTNCTDTHTASGMQFKFDSGESEQLSPHIHTCDDGPQYVHSRDGFQALQ